MIYRASGVGVSYVRDVRMRNQFATARLSSDHQLSPC